LWLRSSPPSPLLSCWRRIEEGNYKAAMKQCNAVLKEIDKADTYSKLMLGQIHTLMSTEKLKPKNQLRLLEKAGKYYRSVLLKDARSIYAANGLGVVLAHKSRFGEAKDVFAEVKDVAPEMKDVWVNLAHVFTHQQFHANAIKLVRLVRRQGSCLHPEPHWIRSD
jgi:hypothetical protein